MPRRVGLPPNGARIRALRRERGIGPSDLAHRVGIKYGHLANIENGHNRASAEVLAGIAVELGCRIEELIAHSDDPTHPPGRPDPAGPGPTPPTRADQRRSAVRA